jgi:hypothetical protein
MPDFNIRSDSLDVEQIMEQIRSRIREKRGVDYTEQQIRELAAVKLEKFLDPRNVRSDLLEQFRKARPPDAPLDLPNFSFESSTLFDSHRGIVRFVRRLLLPILKLFFNPNPLIQALHLQARLNTIHAEHETAHRASHHLFYELIHNLVVETTRLAIEVKNLKMRVESLSSRLEFNERRARALESVVVYKSSAAELEDRTLAPGDETAGTLSAPGSHDVSQPGAQGQPAEGPGQKSRRRRRRRGRRSGPPASAIMTSQPPSAAPGQPAHEEPDRSDHVARDDFQNVSGAAVHRHEPLSADIPASEESSRSQAAPDAARSGPEPSAETSPPSTSEAGTPTRSEPDDSDSQ